MKRFWLSLLCFLALASSCDVECRNVSVTEFDFECDSVSDFVGELHFDRAATFRSFLRDECLAPDDERVSEWTDSIDFTQDALVFTRGSNNLNDECLAERSLQSVETCTSGLRIAFEDVVSAEEVCSSPFWVVAFSLPREELRAALESQGGVE